MDRIRGTRSARPRRRLEVSNRAIDSRRSQARNTLLYVLSNARKYAAESGRRLPTRWVDSFSSARQIDGWRQSVRLETGVVVPPSCWLLRVGWRRHGGDLDAHAIPLHQPP